MVRSNPLLRRHDFETETAELNQLLKRDDSGLQFIDYLGGIESELDDPNYYAKFILPHKNLVEKGLDKYQNDMRILSKYLWLRHYHNTVVSERLADEYRQGSLIPE